MSVALHDGSLAVTTLVSNLNSTGPIAASTGFLGSTTNVRVALVETLGSGSSVLKLYAFDAAMNTIVHEQDTVALPFSPRQLAIPGVSMGSFASTPLDAGEFPVVMLGEAGQFARTYRTHASTTAQVTNHTLLDDLPYEGIVASPLRPELYAFTDDGVVVGFDPLSFVPRFQENISTGASLSALSVSPDGNSLFFANAFGVFAPNDPEAPPYYDSIWIFNP